MRRNVYIVLAVLITCFSMSAWAKINDPKKLMQMNRKQIEETLGKPNVVTEEKDQQTLEYWIDEDEPIGNVKYKIVFKNDVIMALTKAATDMKFRGNLTKQQVDEANENTKINNIMQGKAPAEVPIENQFSDKIVYTTDASFDKTILENDCKQRGGKFQECGSICDDRIKDQTCVTVCAFTCQLSK
jgi:hypothetical protein